MILVHQKLDNLKSNLTKEIKEIERQTVDQNDELTVCPNDISGKCDYQSVLKILTAALQKQKMDNNL